MQTNRMQPRIRHELQLDNEAVERFASERLVASARQPLQTSRRIRRGRSGLRAAVSAWVLVGLLLSAGCGRATPETEMPSTAQSGRELGRERSFWENEEPIDWRKTQIQYRAFEYSVDRSAGVDGRAAARISGNLRAMGRTASISQVVDAAPFRGRRAVFSAQMRQKDVQRWAHAWIAVRGLANENLGALRVPDEPVTGSHEWKLQILELDVPQEAETIAVGFVLFGPGELWLDDARLTREDDIKRENRLRNPSFEAVR